MYDVLVAIGSVVLKQVKEACEPQRGSTRTFTGKDAGVRVPTRSRRSLGGDEGRAREVEAGPDGWGNRPAPYLSRPRTPPASGFLPCVPVTPRCAFHLVGLLELTRRKRR
ncbi:hypothetical protein Pta02_27670 [Planobispora takensis]|uniref:Uncharacterized protein n=1 Tax=Planobispora takensis TaxID=1367882 RepID=A0A8J3WSK5_9ACTN|nr:hypothetical protein Pta02_27670 [Planobispora takensis]